MLDLALRHSGSVGCVVGGNFLLTSFTVNIFTGVFTRSALSFGGAESGGVCMRFLKSSGLVKISFSSEFAPVSP